MTFRYLFRPFFCHYLLLSFCITWFAQGLIVKQMVYPKRRIIEESLIRVWSKCVTRAKKTRTTFVGEACPSLGLNGREVIMALGSSSPPCRTMALGRRELKLWGNKFLTASSVLQSLISGFHWPNPTGSPRTREAVNVIFSGVQSSRAQSRRGKDRQYISEGKRGIFLNNPFTYSQIRKTSFSYCCVWSLLAIYLLI